MAMKHADKPINEGEGNRTAAKAYNRETQAFAKSGKAETKGREAALAVDGTEGDELARAEVTGKERATIAGRTNRGKP